MTERFLFQKTQAFDHWRQEFLTRITLESTPSHIDRIQQIFSFQSDCMQNIIAFNANHYRIEILTQPFKLSPSTAFTHLSAIEAKELHMHYFSLLAVARELSLDFIDFSRPQILPNAQLRLPWSIEPCPFPRDTFLSTLFPNHPELMTSKSMNIKNDLSNHPDFHSHHIPFFCCRDDFASSLLHSRFSSNAKPNTKICIHTSSSWQKAIAIDNLFHHLSREETLLIHLDLKESSLAEQLAGLGQGNKLHFESQAIQANEFKMFLKKSIFHGVVLLIQNLNRKEDDRLLRHILDAEEACGVTAILFDNESSFPCDLEFHDNPPNHLSKHWPTASIIITSDVAKKKQRLLENITLVGVPMPIEAASLLAEENGKELITELLHQNLLIEDQIHRTVTARFPIAHPNRNRKRSKLLSLLAENCDWAYARLSHLFFLNDSSELERYLLDLAQHGVSQVIPSYVADLIEQHLLKESAGKRILEIGVDLLIKANYLDQAERILVSCQSGDPILIQLKKAHLAMRRRKYDDLGQLLSAFPPRIKNWDDELCYLRFVFFEKSSRHNEATQLFRKIHSPYYHNLSVVLMSDRAIYGHNFIKARTQLSKAINYFSINLCIREEMEARCQEAKLLREQRDTIKAEAAYKTIFIQCEAEGLLQTAASIAVDLGNLFMENDNDFQAEGWYRKAEKLFTNERDWEGLMLVKSNLINVLIAKGEWLEADRLLHELIAHDEEKKLINSMAVDILNRAELETLRLHDALALDLVSQASVLFLKSENRKGLSECAFLRGRITHFCEDNLRTSTEHRNYWTETQRQFSQLITHNGHPHDAAWQKRLFCKLDAIHSRKLKFEALRLLLIKYRNPELLPRFHAIAQELSPRRKNYFYFEYLYMVHELTPDGPPNMSNEEFSSMYDFFTVNRRSVSARLIRHHCQRLEVKKSFDLYDDARLVECSRNWRLPSDFFSTFLNALAKVTPVNWLVMDVFEQGTQILHFSNDDAFVELSREMLQQARKLDTSQTYDLQEIRRCFRSPERIIYPYAISKIFPWKLNHRLEAWLIVAFFNEDLQHQDFYERHRETFAKFSLLLQNFLQHTHNVDKKLGFIVGNANPMQELKRMIAHISQVDFSLLITGESGCGKELVAQAVHRLSSRAQGPFVPVNVAAIPDTLLEAELFGYKRGAFSGAIESRTGLMAAADHGTLFLDEIADLPLSLQAKLLRALQEREIRRLGENQAISIDIRLVSASNKNLQELIRNGMFREDLYYRLRDIVIHVPPLRERREDIPLLIGHFLDRLGYGSLDSKKLEMIAAMFRNDDFPGNVRELESRIKSLVTFYPNLEFPTPVVSTNCRWRSARAEFERNLLKEALSRACGNRTRAAQELGISRMMLFNLVKKYQIV